jgi:hypothetical protein
VQGGFLIIGSRGRVRTGNSGYRHGYPIAYAGHSLNGLLLAEHFSELGHGRGKRRIDHQHPGPHCLEQFFFFDDLAGLRQEIPKEIQRLPFHLHRLARDPEFITQVVEFAVGEAPQKLIRVL